MNDLFFRVELLDGIDCLKAHNMLKAVEFKFLLGLMNAKYKDDKIKSCDYITGDTTKDLYEKAFKCTIEKKIVPVTKRNGKTTLCEAWVEKTPAKIPVGLENHVKKIYLEKPAAFYG